MKLGFLYAGQGSQHPGMGADLYNAYPAFRAVMDGAAVVKVPAVRLPENFGFMLAHPCATVAPLKLEDYTIHENPPGISGALVEGRICYDAFVLDNKAKAVYYQAQTAAGPDSGTEEGKG